ncbi:unnamed protein product, partial [Mesorhabditis spiculigera]
MHQGHIGLQDALSGRSHPSIMPGQAYTFEIVMTDTTQYDYIIERCVLNGQERFFDQYGCIHCTNTFVKVWETEGYGQPGSIKRTLVHLIAPTSVMNIECDKSCVRKPLLFAFVQELVHLNYYCPVGPPAPPPMAPIPPPQTAYPCQPVTYGRIPCGFTKDAYPFPGYIPPPPPPPIIPPPPLPPADPYGGGVIIDRERHCDRNYDDRSGYYDANTGTVSQGHYKKNRSRSPHIYSNGGAFETYSRDYNEGADTSTYINRESRVRRSSEGAAYVNRAYPQPRERSYDGTFHARATTIDGGYGNPAYNYRENNEVVGLEGGYDRITRVEREYEDEDDDYVVEKDIRTTTTTKIIEERRVLDEEDAGYSTELRDFGRSHATPIIRVNHSPSEENFREETVQRAVYAHSVPV